MVECSFNYTICDQKTIERIIADDNLDINHMVLTKDDALPEHYSNSNAYLIIIRGTITLRLNDQDPHDYPQGSIVTVPFKTKMNVSNSGNAVLEFFVVKAPSPKVMVDK